MMSFLSRGQGQGKGTLKQKEVKFNARWRRRATCEISSIRGQSVSVVSGAKAFHGFPQSPVCGEAGQHYADRSVSLNHSKRNLRPAKEQEGSDSQQPHRDQG